MVGYHVYVTYNGIVGAVAVREEQWWWLGRMVVMVEH